MFKQMLAETIGSFLRTGMGFKKVGRNGKIYLRQVRWSDDMKSVEWWKQGREDETPRYILMNSINNAEVSFSEVKSVEICTLASDHRTLELVVMTNSQRHWADLTQHIVENRGVAGYLDSLSG